MSILTHLLFTATDATRQTKSYHTLPGLYAALCRGEIGDFPRLRPHQRHVWHAFLVQLAALSLTVTRSDALPTEDSVWAELLTGLASDEPDAWALISLPDRPAFLQAPVPGGALKNFKVVETPDALDVLILSRNHDLKAGVMPSDDPELWLYALVSLQTQGGFLGTGNYGISRMNGGFANRPSLAVSPDRTASEHFQRDCRRAIKLHRELSDRYGYRSKGGLGLVWLEPWDGAESLNLSDLDLFYIEICRRVRLGEGAKGGMVAYVAGSKAARIDSRTQKGVTGDLWTPLITEKNEPKALTVDPRGFAYQALVRLLFPSATKKGESVEKAPLQYLAETDAEDGLVILARALVRGQGKTEGFYERRVAISKETRKRLGITATDQASNVAHERVKDVGDFANKVLYPAIMTVYSGAPRTKNGERARDDDTTKNRAGMITRHLDILIDPTFFDDLDMELAVLGDEAARRRVRAVWIRDRLLPAGKQIVLEALSGAPDAAARHWRVRVKSREVLYATFMKQFGDRLKEAFDKMPTYPQIWNQTETQESEPDV